jgi:hypothetical protein
MHLGDERYRRRDTEKGRYYQVEEKLYPSVTNILDVISKPALNKWIADVEREMVLAAAADIYAKSNGNHISRPAYIAAVRTQAGKVRAAQKEMERAGKVGTQIHKLAEWSLRKEMGQSPGKQPKIGPEAQHGYTAWEEWRKSVNLKPLFIEQVVWSNEFGYAGTADLFAEVEGVLTCIDWKSGKRVYPEASLQNAAYRHAYREMGHGDCKQGLIILLPKTAGHTFKPVPALPEEECMEAFLAFLMGWAWLNK